MTLQASGFYFSIIPASRAIIPAKQKSSKKLIKKGYLCQACSGISRSTWTCSTPTTLTNLSNTKNKIHICILHNAINPTIEFLEYIDTVSTWLHFYIVLWPIKLPLPLPKWINKQIIWDIFLIYDISKAWKVGLK